MLGTAVLAAALLVAAPQGRIVYDTFLPNEHIALYRERADGGGRVRVTWGGRYWTEPRWSPDGRRLVANGDAGLVVLTPAGHVLRRIPVAGVVDQPRWSPDGTRLAYLVLHCDGQGQPDPACAALWIVRPDGSGRRRLSTPTAVDVSQTLGVRFSWSPDGRRIAYARQDGIEVVDVATGRTRLVARAPRLIQDSPSWSPDGRTLLFVRQRAPGRGTELVTLAADGRLRAIPGTIDAAEPRWSPDGSHIAFLVQAPSSGGGWPAIVIRPDGRGRRKVATAGDYQVLVWSPDSAYVLVPAGSGGPFLVARADGRGAPRRIPGGDDPDWGP